MLRGADDELPPRYAALAGFAVKLTARPWAVTRDDLAPLVGQGLDEVSIEAAIGVVAMFNYLSRVADASGIEFDYHSPLPRFEPDHDRPALPRPADRATWPVLPAELRTLPSLGLMSQAWRRWHDYVFESDEPLAHRDRQLLARAAAEESCDAWRAGALADYEPKNDAEAALVAFGRKLARAPWQMRPEDLDGLRALGHPEPALLHAIAVVALQNAESRVAVGRAALTT